MDRVVAFKALVGSHNYNLNDENSDKDYKVFVLPTFEDLYNREMYANQIIGEEEDLDIHDIRKLPNLFYKSNINFIEVLYSNEIIIGEEMNRTQEILIKKIFEKRDEIVRMNLPHLFNAGMHLNKIKLLRKGTEGTQHLVDKFGYDTKQAQHAYRVLNFIERFSETELSDFKQAITYFGEDKKFMLDIKGAFFNAESFENFVSFYHDARFKPLKEKYHSFKPNEELKKELEMLIMNLVKVSVVN